MIKDNAAKKNTQRQGKTSAQNPANGQELELTIDRIAHGGFGVARSAEGRVVFVSDSIPGERVRARVNDANNKSFWRADTVEVLEASPHRVEHFWPEARLSVRPEYRAGGADFGHIVLDQQRVLKAEVLKDSLKRFGKISDADQAAATSQRDCSVRPIGDGAGIGWRTRINLQVDSRGRLGVFSPRTHNIVPIASFPLATNELLAEAPLGQLFEGASSLDLAYSSTGQYSITIDEMASKKPLVELVQTTSDSSIAPREFQLAPDGFWQVHRDAPSALAQAAVSMIDAELFVPDAHNLDLYGGVGLFAAAIADALDPKAYIRTVESNPSAVKFADRNLDDLHNVSAVESDTLLFLREQIAAANAQDGAKFARATVLLDPPRSGAGKSVIEALGRLAPRQIIYVACDPVAFSRDVALLDEQGYQLSRLLSYDLFPNTHHFEVVAAFVRI
ncbi:MAG: TRAM domain-containing protein [Microbacteriaceae bacterium]